MAGSYVDFVESLIYGTGLAPNANHRDWLLATPSPPAGNVWLEHHVDRMLAAFEAWAAAEAVPPVTPWNGVVSAPWGDASTDFPLGPDLDGTFTGIASLTALGNALRTRYENLGVRARELGGQVKAPFSYRYWSYMKWAQQLRRRFQGLTVFPTAVVYDRDGTVLSATPFADTFDDLHRTWHLISTPGPVPTPGLRSTAGQRSGAGLPGMTRGEEFLQFHRDHMELFHRWLARTRQPPLRPIDMGRPNGWPPTGPPHVVNPPAPWAYDEASFAASGLPGLASRTAIGAIENSYHVDGHAENTDLGPLSHNNYVPRFHNWHGWIDGQWWWREPRFAESDPLTGERTRRFRPVLQGGGEFPGPLALSIVRDPLLPADSVYPADAIGGVDLATGAGSVRLKLYVRDPLGRSLRMRLRGEVLDGAGAVVPAETVTVLRNIGPAGDHPLDTEFTEDLAFAGAFASDDPARANPAVGFVNGRIRITGHLWVPGPAPDDPATSPDSGFVHEDVVTIDLVREKLAPQILIYQDLSSFSEDQVNATMSAGVAAFDDAFSVMTQDRTTPSVPFPIWPPLVADEVKGLIVGRQAASGVFDDIAHAPDVVLWQEAADAPIAGVTVRLMGAPLKEDPTLPPELPQRLTWRYAVDFAAVNDAFAGLLAGDVRTARLRVTARDRAGNVATAVTPVKLFKDANPYMIDGPVPWLSVDTRVFSIREGESRLGETIVVDQPLPFLSSVLGRLNAGTTGAETFETLPTEGPGAALEYATAIPNVEAGTSQKVYNFAFAKVRMRGAAGAVGVRAFFRLFRYAAPSLLFSDTQGYRAFDDGAGRIVPLLGFEGTASGSPLTSVPFFASPRVDSGTASMETQTDAPNTHAFPAGPVTEQVWYCGAWLDINDPGARLPAARQTPPDGPFTPATTQSLRTLMHDFHQCMVVELRYAGDPTTPGSSPSDSDNLAQRNLSILTSANPGDVWTRTVEQAFDLDLSRPPRVEVDRRAVVVDAGHDDHTGDGHGHEHGEGDRCESCGVGERDVDGLCVCCGGVDELEPLAADAGIGATSTFHFAALVQHEAMSIAMRTRHERPDVAMHERHGGSHDGGHGGGHDVTPFIDEAARAVRQSVPVVFHPARWLETASLVDELRIDWNDLPSDAGVSLYLPGVAAAQIVSLRNSRHAPPTVHATGDSTLRLDVGEVTYIPIPPVRGNRLAGTLAITLPKGTRAPARYVVDVTQLRAGTRVRNGGFRIEIVVRPTAELLDGVDRAVATLTEQLRATRPDDRWHPVLERRLATERLRALGLAAATGTQWEDPTVWTDENGAGQQVRGTKVRVVLERIDIRDDRDPWLKGAGEIDFEVMVHSPDNGGLEQHTRLPDDGHYKIASGESLAIDRVVFEGFVETRLALRISAMERDTFDPDDNLGTYARVFACDAGEWLGRYGPGDEPVDPERVGYWQVHYRIERA